MERLSGKVAVVTGAGQGIGRAVSLCLAREGAQVALVGRTSSKLEAVRDEIAADAAVVGAGGSALALSGDVTSPQVCVSVIADTVEAFGGLDILVNNAVDTALGSILDVRDEAWLRSFETGPMAALRLMRAAHPHLLARGGGSIVNMVTSAAVRWDASGFGAYAATKEALRSLGRTAASEWGKDGIRVNNVAPHALTPALQWWTGAFPEEAAEFVKTIPLGRIGDPVRDVAGVVVWLCTDEARYLTGATVPVDGGQARWA